MKSLLLLFTLAVPSVSATALTPIEKKPVKPNANTLVYPVSGKKSNIGGFFGDYRNGGRSHKGVDIYAKKGTPVVAVCDGVITSTATEKMGGKTIRLKAAGQTWTAYYAHLDKLNVRVGQYVQKGETIGTIGNTGNARRRPSHLHFGIYGGGRAVNPLPYVKNSKKILNPSSITARQKSNTKSGQVAVNKIKINPAPATYKSTAKISAVRAVMADIPGTDYGNASGEHVWKSIRVYLDAKGSYFVTKSLNVVRLEGRNFKTIGKWKELKNEEYQNCIILDDKKLLYIYKDGTIVTQSGEEIGRVN